jgi:hypothetical protein
MWNPSGDRGGYDFCPQLYNRLIQRPQAKPFSKAERGFLFTRPSICLSIYLSINIAHQPIHTPRQRSKEGGYIHQTNQPSIHPSNRYAQKDNNLGNRSQEMAYPASTTAHNSPHAKKSHPFHCYSTHSSANPQPSHSH